MRVNTAVIRQITDSSERHTTDVTKTIHGDLKGQGQNLNSRQGHVVT